VGQAGSDDGGVAPLEENGNAAFEEGLDGDRSRAGKLARDGLPRKLGEEVLGCVTKSACAL
jgi:hypothetical protein